MIEAPVQIKNEEGDITSQRLSKVWLITPPLEKNLAFGLHEFSAQQHAELFKKRGVDAEIVSITNEDLIPTLIKAKEAGNQAIYGGLLGFNVLLKRDNLKEINLFELLDIPVMGCLADQPFAKFMIHRMENFPKNGVMISQSKVLLDTFQSIFNHDGNMDLLRSIPPITSLVNNPKQRSFSEREIDILVPLGLNKFLKDDQTFEQKLKQFGTTGFNIGINTYKYSISDLDSSILSAFNQAVEEETGSKYAFNNPLSAIDKGWLQLLHLVDFQVRLDRRLKVLMALFETKTTKSIVITAPKSFESIFGEMTECMNVSWIGELPATELNNLYANSKMVLSINPTYPDQIHDRVRNAMANGACVISDYNRALQSNFEKKGGIFLLNRDNTDIKDLIELSDSVLAKTASTGKNILDNDFSFDQYGDHFLNLLNKYCG